MFLNLINWLVQVFGHLGYTGIVILMALESSFFPFPSEVVIPPAAYLSTTGEMNIWCVIISGTTGSLLGSLFNYYLAVKFGRPFFKKYGHYLMVSSEVLTKSEHFFERHGYISTLVGRLIPGIRQYISLPAGLAKMNIGLFCLATAMGAGLWVSLLAAMGFWFGQNQQLVTENLHWISLSIGGTVFLAWCIYLLKHKLNCD